MLIYLKKFLLSPYYLYKSIQNIKAEIKTPPIVEHVEIPKIPETPEISYEKLYADSQKELAMFKEKLNQQLSQHQIQLKEVAEQKNAELKTYKDETEYTIDTAKKENMTLTLAKQEIESKYDGVTKEMNTLITQHNSDALEIKKLMEKNKILKEELDLVNKAKSVVENEALALSNRLIYNENTMEESHKQYVQKYKYLSHSESQALKQERDRLQKTVEKSEKDIAVIKGELNKLYIEDVGISKKLVTYLEDLKKIEHTIVTLTDNLQEISQKKTNYISQIDSQKHQLDTLAIIDRKTTLNYKDIEQLTERIQKVQQVENIITNAQNQLKILTDDEEINIAKLKDQRILQSKRHGVLIDQISQWIHDKSTYYAQHALPLSNDRDSLDNYVEKLKQTGKFPGTNQIDSDKVDYNFREYEDYIQKKDYSIAAITRRLPEIMRYNNEKALTVIPQAKSKISKTQSITKLTDETKYKLTEEFANKPVINAEQERINQMLLQSMRYIHKPLPISRNTTPIYRPQTTTATNENKVVNSVTEKITINKPFNDDDLPVVD
jgi:hypothetical protein